jgi:ElaB/YqjD/DUF883 family membrane-anchored ribosome-binding protein
VTTSADGQQKLEKEIEQTRERLGDTVEALAAKVDVQAQAQEKLGQLTARLMGKATEATRQLQLQDKANQAKQQATQAGQQIRKRPIPAAATVGALGALVLFFTLIGRWMRRDK